MTDATKTPPAYLKIAKHRLAYLATPVAGKADIVFLHGHGSDMHGDKAQAIAEWATRQGFGCLRFDYFGHGASSGDIADGTISQWKADVLAMLDSQIKGDCYVVGSSLGGWLMLLAAEARPTLKQGGRIKGLVGIAAAPDFTETLIWQTLTPAQQKAMAKDGHIALANPYSDDPVVYPYRLITDGRNNLLLGRGSPLAITCPVRLLHGMRDAEVPPATAQAIADALPAETDVQVMLDADADHRFSQPDQIDTILATLAEITRQDKTA
ncbi:MAG: alpha/beta hydrolase [Proteobacteria bacterium]|nr:alpha/beta hydrolase [Pseudomonadota bacterium]